MLKTKILFLAVLVSIVFTAAAQAADVPMDIRLKADRRELQWVDRWNRAGIQPAAIGPILGLPACKYLPAVNRYRCGIGMSLAGGAAVGARVSLAYRADGSIWASKPRKINWFM